MFCSDHCTELSSLLLCFSKGLQEQRFLWSLVGMTYMSGVLWQDFRTLAYGTY